jgi:hypothetical protein
MCKQLNRWKHGFFQNIRQHFPSMVRHKPMLALWVGMALFEIMFSPVIMLLPIIAVEVLHRSLLTLLFWWVGSEAVMVGIPIAVATKKRRANPWRVLMHYPSFYVLKIFNMYYDFKAMTVELILAPLGLATSLATYEKGH